MQEVSVNSTSIRIHSPRKNSHLGSCIYVDSCHYNHKNPHLKSSYKYLTRVYPNRCYTDTLKLAFPLSLMVIF